MNSNWIQQAQEKLAAAAATTQDDKAITEAFAQQAYTAIGNRDRDIMRDPYMLGFEIVSKNEENTRLVGCFAFRVSGEILLAPVFYLNGQIKGQDLLYRKGVNRFVPNTDKWVSYLLSRGEDSEGRAVDRKALDARIHLDLRQMAGSRIKSAGHDDSCCDACKKGEKCTCKKPSAEFDPDTIVITNLPDDATAEEKKQWEERGFIRREVKMASIRGLFKEAMEAWQATEPEHLFAQVLLEQGMQKQAAELAERLPEFAEMVYLSGALDKGAQEAASPEAEKMPNSELKAVDDHNIVVGAAEPFDTEISLTNAKSAGVTLYLEPGNNWSEPEIEDFYKQGFALRDPREMKYLADAYVESDFSKDLTTLREAGVQTAVDAEGNKCKVLWAPVVETDMPIPLSGSEAVASAYRNSRKLGAEYVMLCLEGPNKGAMIRYGSGTTMTDIPVFQDTIEIDQEADKMSDSVHQKIEGEQPKAGKAYAVWIPSLGKVWQTHMVVRSVSKSDGITKINFGTNGWCYNGDKPIVINDSLDLTSESDLHNNSGMPVVLGTDAVFIPLTGTPSYRQDAPKGPAAIQEFQLTPIADFMPLTVGRMNDALLKTKTASIQLIPVGHGRTDVMVNGRRRAEEEPLPMLALKLAGILNLPSAQAIEFAKQAAEGQQVSFNVISPAQKMKLASAYYERHINPDVEFQDFDYDQDFNTPIHHPDQNQAVVQLMRHQQVSPQRRYLDAVGNSGPRNKPFTHIPDEMVLQMANPIQEMTAIGQQLGLKSLLDHGAVGSLTKVFDAGPFIQQYVDKLESSLDYLARLLFMLFWKPKDFADAFGSDDLPNLENKISGVFLSYGDIVLELRQSAGDKN